MAVEPVSMGLMAASLAMTVAGAVTQAAGAQQQAQAARQAGEYNKKVMEVNARAAREQAAFAADQKREQYRRIVSSQRAAAGRAGITLESIEDQEYDTIISGELDAMAEQYKGAVASNRYEQEGNLSLMESQARAKSLGYQGTGALLSGVASVGKTAADFNWGKQPKISS